MNLTLYRKHRPKTFGEIEGQEHVVRTLQGALMAGRVSHAYLFSGPRGTGKTTIARLLAKALNCQKRDDKNHEPCNLCGSCEEINSGRSLDLIEIDAASNRGIDDIRSLRESTQVAAASSNYKIFIIDEVHMLTKDAFNALLKTLEEPPSHVIFILATTEPHKVLETILSRVQRFDFKKITQEQIIQKLKKVARAEKIEIDNTALATLALHASGSLRDAESAMAKLIAFAGSIITAEHAAEILGIVSQEVHKNFLAAIVQKDIPGAVSQISKLYESGVDLESFTKQFINFMRACLISQVKNNNTGGLIDPAMAVRVINVFIKAKSELKNSPIPQLPLELAVLELTNAGQS